MEFILDWMYSGSCDVSDSNAPPNLRFLGSIEMAATSLQIDSLRDFVSRKLGEIDGSVHRKSLRVKEEVGGEEEEAENGSQSSSEDESHGAPAHCPNSLSPFQQSMNVAFSSTSVTRLKKKRISNLSLRMATCLVWKV